ncbi:MAG: acylphosphatase [Patescibacteria group bacterium]
MAQKLRAHVFVSGQVQRVFFRHGTKEKAKELGVFGWVRNLPDNRVEAIFEGDMDNVERMIEWTRRGPRFAKVENLIADFENYTGEFKIFETR